MLCSQCGECCKLFLINLTQEEYKSAKYKTQFDEYATDFEEAELCGANIIAQHADGSCIYLKDKTCEIHDIRPRSCRNFFCTSKYPGFISMIRKIQKHKTFANNILRSDVEIGVDNGSIKSKNSLDQ